MRDTYSGKANYIDSNFAPEDVHLKEIRESLRADEKEGINVGPYEGRILQFLIQMVEARNIVEVGTLYGYSTLWMARALPQGGKIISLEKEEGNFSKAKGLIEKTESKDKIEILNGDAVDLLQEISPRGPFDMVFIDANKSGYPKYLDWAEKNVRKGGLIVGDNTFLFGHLTGEADKELANKNMVAAMDSFNKRLSDPDKYCSVIIPTAEGMTVAKKLY